MSTTMVSKMYCAIEPPENHDWHAGVQDLLPGAVNREA